MLSIIKSIKQQNNKFTFINSKNFTNKKKVNIIPLKNSFTRNISTLKNSVCFRTPIYIYDTHKHKIDIDEMEYIPSENDTELIFVLNSFNTKIEFKFDSEEFLDEKKVFIISQNDKIMYSKKYKSSYNDVNTYGGTVSLHGTEATCKVIIQ